MSENNFITPPPAGKPAKPSPNFPLFAHATKRWAKKINGKLVYFGPWSDPKGAMKSYRAFIAGNGNVEAARPRARLNQDRPEKPYPEFPLFPHQTGRWAKKIRGQTHYFGPWSDPDGALEKYLEQKDALHAGRRPREETKGATIKELCNQFLNAKRALVDSGELTNRSWDDYKAQSDLIISHFGKARLVADLDADDFAALRNKLAMKWGPVTLGNVIQRMRVFFKFA